MDGVKLLSNPLAKKRYCRRVIDQKILISCFPRNDAELEATGAARRCAPARFVRASSGFACAICSPLRPALRRALLTDDRCHGLVPRFVASCRDSYSLYDRSPSRGAMVDRAGRAMAPRRCGLPGRALRPSHLALRDLVVVQVRRGFVIRNGRAAAHEFVSVGAAGGAATAGVGRSAHVNRPPPDTRDDRCSHQ